MKWHATSINRSNCKLRTLVKAGVGAPLNYMTQFFFAAHLLANLAMWLRTISDITECLGQTQDVRCIAKVWALLKESRTALVDLPGP